MILSSYGADSSSSHDSDAEDHRVPDLVCGDRLQTFRGRGRQRHGSIKVFERTGGPLAKLYKHVFNI